MIQFQRRDGDKLIEFGGGANPKLNPQCRGGQDVCVDVRMCHDANGNQVTDFTLDFNEPFGDAIKANEFDGALAVYVLEHISWRKVPQFLSEVIRVLKPSGKAVFVIPNTENQMKYILSKPEWDGDEGSMLFGDLDYPENSHRAAFSPKTIVKLMQDAGYENIVVKPCGNPLGSNGIQTDMVVEAVKPMAPTIDWDGPIQVAPNQIMLTPVEEIANRPADIAPVLYDPIKTFDRDYFNGGRKQGGYKPFYWDHPSYEIVARNVLARKPQSVLSLGEGRGYVLKRLEDAGVDDLLGIDIANSCYLTRVSDKIVKHDLSQTPWPTNGWKPDLCFSLSFWEHVPEHLLDSMIAEMERTCGRGLHGITMIGEDDGQDQTRVTIRSKQWWQAKMPRGHEILSVNELRGGNLPEDYVRGDGKNKLNVGCAWTCFHNGWVNIDTLDVSQFAGQYGYRFAHMDVRNGIANVNTGTVDMVYCVKPGGMVRTAEGMKPIQRVFVGDSVLTHKGRWRKVLRTFQREVVDEKMTEIHGTCVPFSLTGNHEMWIQRHKKDMHRTCRYDEPYQWIPSSLVETNDRILMPMPPLEGSQEVVDLADYIEEVGSEKVHAALSLRQEGHTYKSICDELDITWMQVRRWLTGKTIPRGSVLIDEKKIKIGNTQRDIPRFIPVGEKWGRLLGYLLSDGCASGRHVCFYFGIDQEEYANDVVKIMEELFGLNPTDKKTYKNMWFVRYCSTCLSKIFRKLICKAKKPARKKIPSNLLRCGNVQFYRGLITGLWRGDGTCMEENGSYSTASPHLAYQVQEVLYRLGIASSIHRTRFVSPQVGFRGEIVPPKLGNYGVCISGPSWRSLAVLLGEDSKEISRKLALRKYTTDEGIVNQTKIREYRYTGPVYNIEVEEDNSYTVNGVAVHNCSHMLEHLTYREGLAFLRECRRVIKPDGFMRIIVPDAKKLITHYMADRVSPTPMNLGDMNEECDNAPTDMSKLWSIVGENHHALYDAETLEYYLREAGWVPKLSSFRKCGNEQMRQETLCVLPSVSLYVDATPLLG